MYRKNRYVPLLMIVISSIPLFLEGNEDAHEKIVWQSPEGITIKVLTGKQALRYCQEFADLIIALYRPYPHLLDVILTPEIMKQFIGRSFFTCAEGEIITLFDKSKVVGFSYSIPLRYELNYIQEPLVTHNYRVEDYLYIGDTIIHPDYQKKGFLRKMIALHEQRAQHMKCKYMMLITVDRPKVHPYRPVGYQSPDAMWRHFGFENNEGLKVAESWRQWDTGKVEDNVDSVWIKEVRQDSEYCH